jgi:hypothetical protein
MTPATAGMPSRVSSGSAGMGGRSTVAAGGRAGSATVPASAQDAGNDEAAAGAAGVEGPQGGAAGTAGVGVAAGAGGSAETSDAGSSGAAGTGGAAGTPAMEEEPRADLGEGDGSDVITIGDSWMSLGTTGIQQSLVRVSGQRYRTYGVGGTRLLNEQIPNQYASAKRADPDIKTVVMTGGGNDIIQVPGLRDDCMNGGMQCDMVLIEILDKLTDMWTQMATDGVQDVIYVQYSNPEGENVTFSRTNGDGVPKRCEEVPAPLRCHLLETLDIVMGDIPDGIHPSAAAYNRIGEAVYKMMVDEGMRR